MHVRSCLFGLSAALAAAVLAGCTAAPRAAKEPPVPRARPAAPAPAAPIAPGTPPPPQPGLGTLLLVTAASGTRKAGAFSADIGNLWIRGRCTGGEVTLHLDPLIALPIPCGDLPFENRITLRRRHQITLSVSAPQATIWGLRVEQVPGNHIYPPRRLS